MGRTSSNGRSTSAKNKRGKQPVSATAVSTRSAAKRPARTTRNHAATYSGTNIIPDQDYNYDDFEKTASKNASKYSSKVFDLVVTETGKKSFETQDDLSPNSTNASVNSVTSNSSSRASAKKASTAKVTRKKQVSKVSSPSSISNNRKCTPAKTTAAATTTSRTAARLTSRSATRKATTTTSASIPKPTAKANTKPTARANAKPPPPPAASPFAAKQTATKQKIETIAATRKPGRQSKKIVATTTKTATTKTATTTLNICDEVSPSASEKVEAKAVPASVVKSQKNKTEADLVGKCSVCKVRRSKKDCTMDACLCCCTDEHCKIHMERKRQVLFREQVMTGTTPLQLRAKQQRMLLVPKGRFKEPGFVYTGDTVVIWNIYQYLKNPKWREDAIRRSIRRRASEAPRKEIRNNPKRFRKLIDQWYQEKQTSEQQSTTVNR